MQFRASGNSTIGDSRENATLYQEQKKLEKMVIDVLEKGDTNLGNNADILRQSLEVDTLIVDAMLQREIENRDLKVSDIADK